MVIFQFAMFPAWSCKMSGCFLSSIAINKMVIFQFDFPVMGIMENSMDHLGHQSDMLTSSTFRPKRYTSDLVAIVMGLFLMENLIRFRGTPIYGDPQMYPVGPRNYKLVQKAHWLQWLYRMWVKQCHKSPIWEWFIPPIFWESDKNCNLCLTMFDLCV